MRTAATLMILAVSAACTNSTAEKSGHDEPRASASEVMWDAERMFVENATASGNAEVAQARLAEAKAYNPAVKSFATELVSAHTAANEELSALLAHKGISLTDWSERSRKRGSVGGRDDATSATKTGGPPTGAPTSTGTTGASGSIPTTGEAKDRAWQGTEFPWAQAAGADFDSGFLAAQIKAHADAIALYERQAQTGKDPDLKAFASKQLPLLRDHLQQARGLQQQSARH